MWVLGTIPPPATRRLERIAEELTEVTGLELSEKDIRSFESKVPHSLGCCENYLVECVFFVMHIQITTSCKYGTEQFDPDPFTEIARDSMPVSIAKSRRKRRENGQDQVFPDRFFLPSPTLVSHGPAGYACRKCNGKVEVVEFTQNKR
jgi:hypothetical protein